MRISDWSSDVCSSDLFVREATAAVGHHALALGGAHRHAQVGLAGLAEFALAAFGGVQRDHVVARRDAGDALADLDHHARALVAYPQRQQALSVPAPPRTPLGWASAGGGRLPQRGPTSS